jgi:hypothetical protein
LPVLVGGGDDDDDDLTDEEVLLEEALLEEALLEEALLEEALLEEDCTGVIGVDGCVKVPVTSTEPPPAPSPIDGKGSSVAVHQALYGGSVGQPIVVSDVVVVARISQPTCSWQVVV